MEVNIRPAAPDDRLGVVRLNQRSPDLGPGAPSARQRTTWDTMLGTAGLTVYVADLDGDVVGMVSLLVMPNLGYDCCPTAFVEAMVVAEVRAAGGSGVS